MFRREAIFMLVIILAIPVIGIVAAMLLPWIAGFVGQ